MKPFLKWAGNKYRIIPSLQAMLANLPSCSRLIEPFAGSAALFLNTPFPQALVADCNVDLIQLYQTLQAQGEDFIALAETLFQPEFNTPEQYYALRSQFNASTADIALKSALFLYFNRHGFNGLCRYNRKGAFNVPFGRYQKPYFPRVEMQAFYKKSREAQFAVSDFSKSLAQAGEGDLVYCDPPYVPLSATAHFTAYSQGGFTWTQQQQLMVDCQAAVDRGAIVILSNHDTPQTQVLYQSATRKVSLSVQRYISCQGQNRKMAPELLVLFEPEAMRLYKTVAS